MFTPYAGPPLSEEELAAAREVGRCDRSHSALITDTKRIRAYLDAHHGALDLETVVGVGLLEASFLTDLGRLAARGAGELREKAGLFVSRPIAGGDNLAPMLAAAVHADAVRLGLSRVRPCSACGRLA